MRCSLPAMIPISKTYVNGTVRKRKFKNVKRKRMKPKDQLKSYCNMQHQNGVSATDASSSEIATRIDLPTVRGAGSPLLAHSSIEIITEVQSECEPTSAILEYCKLKFLRPYLMILASIGLHPISIDTTSNASHCSYLQSIFVSILLIFGYFLQYLCLYRTDRGFELASRVETKWSNIQTNQDRSTIAELFFGYFIPNTLHLFGFISAVIVCKIVDREYLQNLVERVFLMSLKPRLLCRMLWVHIFCGVFILSILLAYVIPSVISQSPIIKIKEFADLLTDWQIEIKIFLILAILMRNYVEIVTLTSYCIECYLLRTYLSTLSQKLLMHSIESLDWMREMLEFRKLLDHLNKRIAVPVSFLIVFNLVNSLSSFIFIYKCFDFYYTAVQELALSIINAIVWLLLGLLPFFIAASVNTACDTVKANGHQIRVRPYLYHNSSLEELNSTLLFASSLNISAKLFHIPIQSSYLYFTTFIITISIVTIGMCLNFSALGDF